MAGLEEFKEIYNAYFPNFRSDGTRADSLWTRFLFSIPGSEIETLCKRVVADNGDKYRPKLGAFEAAYRRIQEESRATSTPTDDAHTWTPMQRWQATNRFLSACALGQMTDRQRENVCKFLGCEPCDETVAYLCLGRAMVLAQGSKPASDEPMGTETEVQWCNYVQEAGLHQPEHWHSVRNFGRLEGVTVGNV